MCHTLSWICRYFKVSKHLSSQDCTCIGEKSGCYWHDFLPGKISSLVKFITDLWLQKSSSIGICSIRLKSFFFFRALSLKCKYMLFSSISEHFKAVGHICLGGME